MDPSWTTEQRTAYTTARDGPGGSCCPGPSPPPTPPGQAGDVQVFTNDAIRNGKKVGYEAGEYRIVLVTDQRLVAHCVGTLVLAQAL